MIGSGKLCAPYTKRILGTDASQAALAITYDPIPVAGEVPTLRYTNATIQIGAATGGTSGLRVTLVQATMDQDGNAGSSVTTTLDGLTGGTATYTCATLKDLIDSINLVAGFKAWAYNAPHSLSLDVAKTVFVAAGAVAVPSAICGSAGALHTLTRDVDNAASLVTIDGVASKHVAYLRIGNPEERDNGTMKIMSLVSQMGITSSPLIRIYRDRKSEYGDEADVYHYFVPAAATAVKYLDLNQEQAASYQGPFIVEHSSTDDTIDTTLMGYITLINETIGYRD